MYVKAVDGGCGDGTDVIGVGDVDGNNDDGSDDDSCGYGDVFDFDTVCDVAVGKVGEGDVGDGDVGDVGEDDVDGIGYGGDVGDGGYAPMTSTVPGSQSWLLLGITTRYCYITNDNDEDDRNEENDDVCFSF